jgi:hypothetical protein
MRKDHHYNATRGSVQALAQLHRQEVRLTEVNRRGSNKIPAVGTGRGFEFHFDVDRADNAVGAVSGGTP